MQRLRLCLARRPGAVAWLVACVLAVRMLVPAGYMPAAGANGVVLALCPGAAPAVQVAAIHGGHRDDRPHDPASPGAAMPCAFAGTGTAAFDVPVVGIVLLAIALAASTGVRVVLPRPAALLSRWRPPLRAPPLG